jgi:hypothetical protein
MTALAVAEANLPHSARCRCVANQEMNGFEGQYLGSTKTPDLAVRIRNADEDLETKMVVEVGFSEEYQALINDATLWLEGMSSVSLCLLVSFGEEPPYQCPFDDANMDDEKFKKLGFPHPEKLRPRDFHLEGTFGPAIYKRLHNEEVEDEEVNDEEVGDEEPDNEELCGEDSDDEEPDNEEPKWAGNISTAFLERWKRDAKTGKAKKYGKRVVSNILLMTISLTNWYVIGSPYCSYYQVQTERLYEHHARR